MRDKPINTPPDHVSRLRYERERRARVEAEALLEAKSRELYKANQNLVNETNALKESLAASAQLRVLVAEDDLTGLYSRRGLKERVTVRSKETGIYLFDLDHFKSVNDSYGHEAGNALLGAIGQTIRRLTEKAGCAARLGGDEFAIIRPWQGWEEAKIFAELIRVSIEQTFVVIGSRNISRTTSIGIARLPALESLSTGLRLADVFSREAKLSGGNNFCAGDDKEINSLNQRGTFITEEEVKLALVAGEFYYAVQPVWNVEDQHIEGFEALVRWQRPDGTVLEPRQFVDLFDEVIREPTFAALNNAMRKDVVAKLSNFPEAYVSFNYKIGQLGYRGAAKDLFGVYKDVKDFPERVIMIELSEAAFSERGHLETLSVELAILAENGFVIALDDFGIESSNLLRLKSLPIQVLKIDKSLIDGITCLETGDPILDGIVVIARKMKIKIIAEGVETLQQAQSLMNSHVPNQQGYLHAKPMRPEEVIDQLSNIGAHLDRD